ncbi:MAG: DUF5009 domain-containing protein [Bacteroidales bacterium]|nr:DUF5009 domain-containing protein [Bacteroidales bacterium]
MEKTQRYLALDVLRGITISGMILVNTPGSWSYVYAPLRHSQWHGCTPTDLVFPFFLFVMGVSMFFSFKKYGNSVNKHSLFKIIKRTALIFAIGLFLNSFPQWKMDVSTLRILGVLQRIALAYGISALLILTLRMRVLQFTGAFILLSYWAVLYFFGNYSIEGNFTIAVDTAILGSNHMYHGFGIAFDPEGLLSTIPSIVTVLIGYITGWIIGQTERKSLPAKLLILSVILVVSGWLWGLVFPINKPLWTSSYVLYTAGWALLLLTVLIWLIDIKNFKKWTGFFVIFGMNPLFIYALSILWVKFLIYVVNFNRLCFRTLWEK